MTPNFSAVVLACRGLCDGNQGLIPLLEIMRRFFVSSLAIGTIVLGCSGTDNSSGSTESGGSVGTGGTVPVGGSSAVGGAPSSGGQATSGGSSAVAASGGFTAAGGALSTGGTLATGGARPTGGNAPTGGSLATGGRATGGNPATGGSSSATGGRATGGNPATGGTPATGGMTGTSCGAGTSTSSDVVVSLSSVQQKISGFGVSSAWAGSYANASDADYLWSTTTGAGLSLLRIRYGDGLTIAKSAVSYGVTVWMTPWGTGTNGAQGGSDTTTETNPNGCTNGSMPVLTNPTGLASDLVTWVQNAKTQGVPIYAVSAENEPDSCGINQYYLLFGCTIGHVDRNPGSRHGQYQCEGHGARDDEWMRVSELFFGHSKRLDRLERREHLCEPRIWVRHASFRTDHRGCRQRVLGNRGQHGNCERRLNRRWYRECTFDRGNNA